MEATDTTMMVTETDIKLARVHLNGSLSEDELRSGFVPADAAIIVALKRMVSELRSERDDLEAELKLALARVGELERKVEYPQVQMHNPDSQKGFSTSGAHYGDEDDGGKFCGVLTLYQRGSSVHTLTIYSRNALYWRHMEKIAGEFAEKCEKSEEREGE